MLRVAGLSEGDFEAGGAEGGDVDAGGKAVEGEGSAGEAGVVDGAAAKVGDDQIKGRAYGGGGTSSDLPWGRNPDEDDSHFTYRCMMQAHKMLRPTAPKRSMGGRR